MGGGGGGAPKPTSSGGPFGGSMIKHRAHPDAEFDITAMIDLVFMMNIYFLVTFLTAAAGEVDLPAADHVKPLDADNAVIMTVVDALDGGNVKLFLGDGESGEAITDPEAQKEAAHEFAEKGVAEGKKSVLIKAEKKVRLKDLFRISSAASIEGAELSVAVTEKDGH